MRFITFEGGEGSGKTTQSKLLQKAFAEAAIEAIYTREPGGSDSAEIIRELLVSESSPDWSPMTELLLVNAARYEHAKTLILPSIEKGVIVICDRFVDSTMAYQGYGHKLGRKLPAIIHNFTMQGLSPDLTFVLDIDVSEGLSRVKSDNSNRYEKMNAEFHERVRRGFQEIANLAVERCVLIDASKTPQEIHKKIIATVNKKANLTLRAVEFSGAI